MRTKSFLISIFFLLLGVFTAQAQDNKLSIPQVTIAPGETIALPVNLDNTADIVALQFTLTIPDGFQLSEQAGLSERLVQHQMKMKAVGTNKYMVMIFSSSNAYVIGRTGKVLSLPLTANSGLTVGEEYPLTLSDVIISGKDGSNLLTGVESGKVTVRQNPDLEVGGITFDQQKVAPGEILSVNWKVKNVGGQPTVSGWTEQIFLKSKVGESKLLGSLRYVGGMEPKQEVGRNAALKVPSILGLDGDAEVLVKIVPDGDSGEPSWLRGNNEAVSGTMIWVGRLLMLTPPHVKVSEADAPNVRFCLTRSGSMHSAETFNLTATNDGRLHLPQQVVIPEGQASTYFTADITPNQQLDKNGQLEFSVAGDKYEVVTSTLTLRDDTDPELTVTADVEELREGDHLTLHVQTNRIVEKDVAVGIRCDYSPRFEYPDTVVIKSGTNKLDVLVKTKDDEMPNAEQMVTFTFEAEEHKSAVLYTLLQDNDLPELALTLSTDAISEDAGPLAVTAKLVRKDHKDQSIVIKLNDDAKGGLYYSTRQIEMRKGVDEAVFMLGPVDNVKVDGERTWNISAAIYFSSCNCTSYDGEKGGLVTVPFVVYDNDGPSLSLSSVSSVVNEGGELKLKLERNTEITNSLNVNLVCDQSDRVVCPSTVIIPKGADFVELVLKTIKSDVSKEDVVAKVTASAEGYAKSNLLFTISDRTLPDAQLEKLTIKDSCVVSGERTVANVTLKNTGSDVLPEQTEVKFYTHRSAEALAVCYLQEPLQQQKSVCLSAELSLPTDIGVDDVYAVTNPNRSVKELQYENNHSSIVKVKTIAPFTTKISCDKSSYLPGEKIRILGSILGKDISNKSVEVYVINNGYRHVMNVETEADGSFETIYQPYNTQLGHFDVGACFPTENAKTSMASFEVLGLYLQSGNRQKCDLAIGDVYDACISIQNPTSYPVRQLNVRLEKPLEDCNVTIESVKDIAPGKTADIHVKLEGKQISKENKWYPLNIVMESADGKFKLRSILYYYVRNLQGHLQADITRINTSMTKGVKRDYPFHITNVGKGETGKITLALPKWIKSVTPMELPSLKHGETATVTLRLTPTENMKLNVPVTGTLGINCDQGDGLSLPYRVMPVSEVKGKLHVDVCDEFTYYTEEAPHVAGAKVSVVVPNTSTVVAEGVTDENGYFEVDLPEGYYSLSVTAEKHQQYRDNVLIDPGQTRSLVVNLGYQAVSVDWNVVETEVEDKYEVATTVRYETNVPVPVVVITGPERVDGDAMAIGESKLLHFVVANKGLIAAENVQFHLPQPSDEFSMTPLEDIEPFRLSPHQSRMIPVLFTRHSAPGEKKSANSNFISTRNVATDMHFTFNACMAHLGETHEVLCGEDLIKNESAFALAYRLCGYSALSHAIFNAVGGLIGGTSGGGGSYIGPSSSPNSKPSKYQPSDRQDAVEVGQSKTMCDHDYADAAKDMIDGLSNFYPPFISDINSGMDLAAKHHSNPNGFNESLIKEKNQRLKNLGNTILDNTVLRNNPINDLPLRNLGNLAASVMRMSNVQNKSVNVKSTETRPLLYDRSWVASYQKVLDTFIQQTKNIRDLQLEFFGDLIWVEDCELDFIPLLTQLEIMDPKEITYEKLESLKPKKVSVEQFKTFVDRMYSTLNHLPSSNVPDATKIASFVDNIDKVNDEAIAAGYRNIADQFLVASQEVRDILNEDESSVCASITLKISQTMVMTRQAFRGTLSVFNGHDSNSMTDVKLNLKVTDEEGHVATSHEFQMNAESLDGFSGDLDLAKGWTLGAQSNGVAKILFIPTKFAAPTEEKVYSFGGTLSYVDPFNGLEVVRDLAPVALMVKPSPILDLTYFMQRDVWGNDPMTDAVEPSKEAEFALLINNTGYGDAKNVKITTNQPEIIDNEKGLLIDFDFVSSQLNGQEKVLSLGKSMLTDFGDILSQNTSYAQWWLTSSLLGHFTTYDVNATHVTSYGNPDLSLLGEVNIRELIRSLEVIDGQQNLVGFMTNDIADRWDTPDMLYLSNGLIEPVNSATSSSLNVVDNQQYELVVVTDKAGWTYGHVVDPTYGRSNIVSVVRKRDGLTMPLRNFWQTDRTLRDGQDPLYDNRIHYAADVESVGQEVYVLTFEETPSVLLEVSGIEGLPEEEQIGMEPVNKITVRFNKPICPETFTKEDVQLTVESKPIDLNELMIQMVDSKTFVLDMSAVNKNCGNGYYSLTIHTDKIQDAEGYSGHLGKTANWLMYANGNLHVDISVTPKEAGHFCVASTDESAPVEIEGIHDFGYGEQLQLTAVAHPGYVLQKVLMDGEKVSEEPMLNMVVKENHTIVAHFIKKKYEVQVQANEGGHLQGSLTGVYVHGEPLQIVAVPEEDFVFTRWIINGKTANEVGTTLNIEVENMMQISAEFTRDIYHQKLVLPSGWNWISSYIQESPAIEDLAKNVQRIVGLSEEVIRDPKWGLVGELKELNATSAYKVQTLLSMVKELNGHLSLVNQEPSLLLKTGWNWIGYPNYEARLLSDVVVNPSEHDYITSQEGFAEYIDGAWEGTLGMMNPGIGYLYKSASDKTLNLNFDNSVNTNQSKVCSWNESSGAEYGLDIHKYPNTMNIIAQIQVENMGCDDGHYRIYALNGNELVGVGEYIGTNYYITVHGENAAPISFVAENLDDGNVYMVNETLNFESEVIGSRCQPYQFTIGATTGLDELSTGGQKLRVYRMDGTLVSAHATLKSIRRLPQGVYIINGKKFVVK